jgi:hypothetical protein
MARHQGIVATAAVSTSDQRFTPVCGKARRDVQERCRSKRDPVNVCLPLRWLTVSAQSRKCTSSHFARRFAAAGIAVLVFDYRCFGASGGEPRQRVILRDQMDDDHPP